MNPVIVQHLAERPPLLAGFGRLLGLGETEQKALVRGGLPTWAMVLLAMGAGVAVGAYAEKRWRVMP